MKLEKHVWRAPILNLLVYNTVGAWKRQVHYRNSPMQAGWKQDIPYLNKNTYDLLPITEKVKFGHKIE